MSALKRKLAIFDMDGTLVDSSQAISNAINFVRKRLKLPPLPYKAIISKINDPHINAAQYFYESNHFEVRHEEWFSQYYSANHKRELRLYAGILELLNRLKARGCLLAVATNAYRRSTLETLKHLGILSFFDAVASYDDVSNGKPAPDMLLKILEELKIAPKEAIFIGDSPKDRMASAAAGVEFIALSWGFSDPIGGLKSVDELSEVLAKEC